MKFVLLNKENNIGTITINRPDALNAMNETLLKELYSVFDTLINDHEIRVIILTGSGDKAFIAGADIKAMAKMNKSEAFEFGKRGQALANKIETSPKPVIAAVNGFALGGGCELSLACHIRVASVNAQFSQPEVHLGLVPGWGGTQRLTRLVGIGKSIEMIVTGEMVPARKAKNMGLVNYVVSLEKLLPKAQKIANSIVRNSPLAISLSLKCILESRNVNLEKGLEFEVAQFSQLFETEETREGLSAFVEKRLPDFQKK